MLVDMIKQLTPTPSAPSAAPASQAGPPSALFDRLLGPTTSKAASRPAALPQAKACQDRPELGTGWETADAALGAVQDAVGATDQAPPIAEEPTADNGTDVPPDGQATRAADTSQGDADSPAARADNDDSAAQPASSNDQADASPGQGTMPAGTPSGAVAGLVVSQSLSVTPVPASPQASPGAPAQMAAQASTPEAAPTAPSEQQPSAPTAPGPTASGFADPAPDAVPAPQSGTLPGDQPTSSPDDHVDVQTLARGSQAPAGGLQPQASPGAPLAEPAANPIQPTPTRPEKTEPTAPPSDRPALSGAAQPAPAVVGASLVQAGAARDVVPSAPAPSPSAATVEAGQLAEPDMDHLASRTVRWQHLGVFERGGAARIRLFPPELGSVQVALRTVDNVVRVHLTVQSESVRQLLQSHSDRLVQNLGAHGLTAGRVQVSVETPAQRQVEQDAGQGQGQGWQGPARDDGQQQHQGGARQPFQQPDPEELNLTV